ncbi:MAG: hypothetical protein OEY49_18255 [Candidatus Heimdallarchaeota archaeon]|nr:hypothetical protein [Candidatus Heimdallarchaeota archaeon]
MKLKDISIKIPHLMVPFDLQIEKTRKITLIEWLIMTAIHDIKTIDLPLIADQAGINKVEFLEVVYNDLLRWELINPDQISLSKRGLNLYLKEQIPTEPRDEDIKFYRNLWGDYWEKKISFQYDKTLTYQHQETDIMISDSEINNLYGIKEGEYITQHNSNEQLIKFGFVKEIFDVNIIKMKPWFELKCKKSNLNKNKKLISKANEEFLINIDKYIDISYSIPLNDMTGFADNIEISQKLIISNINDYLQQFLNNKGPFIGYNLTNDLREYIKSNLSILEYFIDVTINEKSIVFNIETPHESNLTKLGIPLNLTVDINQKQFTISKQPGLLKLRDNKGIELFTINDHNDKNILILSSTKNTHYQAIINNFQTIINELANSEIKYFLSYLLGLIEESELLENIIKMPNAIEKLKTWNILVNGRVKTSDKLLNNLNLSIEELIEHQDFIKTQFEDKQIISSLLSKIDKYKGIEELDLFIRVLNILKGYFTSIFTSFRELIEFPDYILYCNEYLDSIMNNLELAEINKLIQSEELLPDKIKSLLKNNIREKVNKNLKRYSEDDLSLIINIIDFTEDKTLFSKLINTKIPMFNDGWGFNKISLPKIIFDLEKTKLWKSIGQEALKMKFSKVVFNKEINLDQILNFLEESKQLRILIPSIIEIIRNSILELMHNKNYKKDKTRDTILILQRLIESNIILKINAQEVLESLPIDELNNFENETSILLMGISEKQLNTIKTKAREKNLQSIIIYIDGPNVARTSVTEVNSDGVLIGKLKNITNLINVIEKKYKIKQIKVVVSKAMSYWIDDLKGYKKLKKQNKIIETPSGESDDRASLISAYNKGAFLISNDKFKDWIEKDENLKDFVKTSVVTFSIDTETYDFVFSENLQKLFGGLNI